jgi:hypothetical protein
MQSVGVCLGESVQGILNIGAQPAAELRRDMAAPHALCISAVSSKATGTQRGEDCQAKKGHLTPKRAL